MTNGQIQTNPYFALIQKYFPQSEWQRAYNVMIGESGGRSNAIGDNFPIRGQTIPSVGLFQIRTLPGRPDAKQLMDPEFNVKYAANMWKTQGWGPWTAARKLGYVGNQSQQQSVQQQPVQTAVQKIMQTQPTQAVNPIIPAPSATLNVPRKASWNYIQPPNLFNSPTTSTVSDVLPTMNPNIKGKSIPEAFYGTKV